MKVKLIKHEWYPIPKQDEDGDEYEIPEQLFINYKRALEAFESVWDELTDLMLDQENI